MARSEHNREAYRLLFGYVGAGLQALATLLVLVSFPISPVWLVVGLLVVVAGTTLWSWQRFAGNSMMPTFAGTLQLVLWILLVGIGVGVMGWGR